MMDLIVPVCTQTRWFRCCFPRTTVCTATAAPLAMEGFGAVVGRATRTAGSQQQTTRLNPHDLEPHH
jgi:hypothetical protein